MVLGLLLARAGVTVTVMEKHADFLRDFRGDTVHASTLTLLEGADVGSRARRAPTRLCAQRVSKRCANGLPNSSDGSPTAWASSPPWTTRNCLTCN